MLTVEEAVDKLVEAQLRIAKELQRTGRCSPAAKRGLRDAMLMVLATRLAAAAAEPEEAPAAGEPSTVTP